MKEWSGYRHYQLSLWLHYIQTPLPAACGVVSDINTSVISRGHECHWGAKLGLRKQLGPTLYVSLPKLAQGFQSDTWPLVNTGEYG